LSGNSSDGSGLRLYELDGIWDETDCGESEREAVLNDLDVRFLVDDFDSDEVLSGESQPSENGGLSFICPLIEDPMDADLIDSIDLNDVSLTGKTSKHALTIKQPRNSSFSNNLNKKSNMSVASNQNG
jgi:hypothetical protein